MFRVLTLSLILVLSACSSKGFKRDEMFAELNQKTVVTDKEIEDVLKLKPQLPRPFTVAVYMNTPRRADFHYSETRWMWTEAEQEMISTALAPLKQKNLVKNIVYIPPTMAAGDMSSIRLAAARHGADAVLVVKGRADVDSFTNNWAYTYFLLAPIFFVPGNEARSLFISHASLWDVRNEYLYMSAEGDAESDQVRPTPFIDREKLVAEAKSASLKLMAGKLKDLAEHFDDSKTAAD